MDTSGLTTAPTLLHSTLLETNECDEWSKDEEEDVLYLTKSQILISFMTVLITELRIRFSNKLSHRFVSAKSKLKTKSTVLNTYCNLPSFLGKWNPVNTTVCCDQPWYRHGVWLLCKWKEYCNTCQRLSWGSTRLLEPQMISRKWKKRQKFKKSWVFCSFFTVLMWAMI